MPSRFGVMKKWRAPRPMMKLAPPNVPQARCGGACTRLGTAPGTNPANPWSGLQEGLQAVESGAPTFAEGVRFGASLDSVVVRHQQALLAFGRKRHVGNAAR